MKKLTPNKDIRYRNGAPRYGTRPWVERVVANDNLSERDMFRIQTKLRKEGNTDMLRLMQALWREKKQHKAA